MFQHMIRRLAIPAAVALLALFAGIAHGEQAAAEAAPAPKPYPLNVCIVAGAELGTMGDPAVLVHEGQEVKFCCSGCIPKFKADPDQYLKKLQETDQPATTQPAEATDDHASHH